MVDMHKWVLSLEMLGDKEYSKEEGRTVVIIDQNVMILILESFVDVMKTDLELRTAIKSSEFLSKRTLAPRHGCKSQTALAGGNHNFLSSIFDKGQVQLGFYGRFRPNSHG
jgi:hypothetical protein